MVRTSAVHGMLKKYHTPGLVREYFVDYDNINKNKQLRGYGERRLIRYIIKRLLQMIPIMLGVTFLTFALMVIAPSDPAEMKFTAQGVSPTEGQLEAAREEMGLDKPFIRRYVDWLGNLLQGDFGNSYADNVPVAEKLFNALPSTVILTISSMVLTLVIAIPAGIFTAVHYNKVPDYIVRIITFIGMSVPNFLIALLLLYFVALKFKLLPVLPSGSLEGLILPTLTLSIVMASKYIRQIRASVLEELGKDYVIAARSRGVKEKVILYKNVLKNSMVSIVTLVGLSFGSLLGGTVVVETIFGWPGLGKLVIDSIGIRDYSVIQGFVVWMSVIYAAVNLLTDLSYRFLDPRIREGQEV